MLISPHYAQLNQQLHTSHPEYGTSGHHWSRLVATLARELAVTELLDYGCGKQTLAASLPGLRVIGYDPALPGLQAPPEPADLVVCTDVLEHVEADCIDEVLDDLCRLARRAAFVTIATRPARKTLPDGRNAHLIVQSLAWWRARLLERFDIVSGHDAAGSEFAVVLRALHEDESLLKGFDLLPFVR